MMYTVNYIVQWDQCIERNIAGSYCDKSRKRKLKIVACTSHIFPRQFPIVVFDCIFQCVVTQEKFGKVLVVAPLPGTWTLPDLFKFN